MVKCQENERKAGQIANLFYEIFAISAKTTHPPQTRVLEILWMTPLTWMSPFFRI